MPQIYLFQIPHRVGDQGGEDQLKDIISDRGREPFHCRYREIRCQVGAPGRGPLCFEPRRISDKWDAWGCHLLFAHKELQKGSLLRVKLPLPLIRCIKLRFGTGQHDPWLINPAMTQFEESPLQSGSSVSSGGGREGGNEF